MWHQRMEVAQQCLPADPLGKEGIDHQEQSVVTCFQQAADEGLAAAASALPCWAPPAWRRPPPHPPLVAGRRGQPRSLRGPVKVEGGRRHRSPSRQGHRVASPRRLPWRLAARPQPPPALPCWRRGAPAGGPSSWTAARQAHAPQRAAARPGTAGHCAWPGACVATRTTSLLEQLMQPMGGVLTGYRPGSSGDLLRPPGRQQRPRIFSFEPDRPRRSPSG